MIVGRLDIRLGFYGLNSTTSSCFTSTGVLFLVSITDRLVACDVGYWPPLKVLWGAWVFGGRGLLVVCIGKGECVALGLDVWGGGGALDGGG